MTSPAEHAATVRDAEDSLKAIESRLAADASSDPWAVWTAHVASIREALVALAARADELQEECHEWNAFYGRLDKKRRDAEARADELERERDEIGPYFVRDMARAVGLPDDASMEAIRERAERAEAALRQIECLDVDWTQGVDENAELLKDIARAALGEQPQPGLDWCGYCDGRGIVSGMGETVPCPKCQVQP